MRIKEFQDKQVDLIIKVIFWLDQNLKQSLANAKIGSISIGILSVVCPCEQECRYYLKIW